MYYEFDPTLAATSHDLALAGQFSDSLIVLDRGSVVIDAPAGVVVRSEERASTCGMML